MIEINEEQLLNFEEQLLSFKEVDRNEILKQIILRISNTQGGNK
jgi:hypothetical protein